MGRNNKPKGFQRNNDDEEPVDIVRLRDGIKTTVIKNGVEFSVQTTSGNNAEESKKWTCPFCSLSFGTGISHIVAWESAYGPEKRRHFHDACWKKFQGRLF
ncbi:MAG: hypothetical protein ACOYKO_03775 [Rhodoluna sp.]